MFCFSTVRLGTRGVREGYHKHTTARVLLLANHPHSHSRDFCAIMSDMEKDQEMKPDGNPAGFKSYMRIFKYADRTSWILYSVMMVAAIAAGTALPLMDLIFGKFVTTFNNFALGAVGPDDYMKEVSKYASVSAHPSVKLLA